MLDFLLIKFKYTYAINNLGVSIGRIITRVLQNVADEIVGAIPFPLEIRLPGALTNQLSGQGFVNSTSIDDIPPPNVKVTRSKSSMKGEGSSELEDMFVDMCLRAEMDPGSVETLPPQDAAPLKPLAALIPPNVTTIDGARIALAQVTDKQFKDMVARFPISWETDWINLRIEVPPGVTLGAPIVASNLKVAVQISGRICVDFPIIGTKCVSITSPEFHLTGRNLSLDLESAPPSLYGSARFDQIDLDICVTILGYDLCIHIPVTDLVNGILGKQPFKIIDFGSLQGPIPYSSKKIGVVNISAASINGGVEFTLDTAVS
jgi:hypothetical protein